MTWRGFRAKLSRARALPAGKLIPPHFNEFCSAKLISRLYWILAFVP
jgi:hypothetical protein